MSIYLIDYENVSLNGLNGIETLNDMDRVYLFYGANPGYIPFEKHILIAKTPAEVHYLRVDRSGKNYLDFQLATYSGYLVAMYASQEYVIVSRDTGFDSIVNFWNRNPEGRDIHFSRREAIVTPLTVRAEVRTDSQVTPVHTAGESTYVPTRQAPISPNSESFQSDEKGRNSRRDLRSRSNRRGGRNNARNSQMNAVGAPQIAEITSESNSPLSGALPELVAEDASDAYSNVLSAEEKEKDKDTELLDDQPIEVTSDPSSLVSKTVPEMLASESENSEKEENEDNVSDVVEKVLPTWQVMTSVAATDGSVGVYVPGTAASGKSNSYPLPSELNLSLGHPSLGNEQSANEAPSDENVLSTKPSDAMKTETTEGTQEDVTDSTAVEQAPISEEEKTKEKPTEADHNHADANDAENDSVMAEDHSLRPSAEQPTRRGRHTVRTKSQRKPALKDAEQKDAAQPEQASEQAATASVHQPLRLTDRFKSQIREAVKEEHLNSGGYVQIYNRVLKCDNKSRLNNELVKVFSQEQGSRIYKLILPTYEEYRKTLEE